MHRQKCLCIGLHPKCTENLRMHPKCTMRPELIDFYGSAKIPQLINFMDPQKKPKLIDFYGFAKNPRAEKLYGSQKSFGLVGIERICINRVSHM